MVLITYARSAPCSRGTRRVRSSSPSWKSTRSFGICPLTVNSSTTPSKRRLSDERRLEQCPETSALVWAARQPGGTPAGGRRTCPQSRRVPGVGPPGRTGGPRRPPVAAPRQGGAVPRVENAGGLRLVVQPVDQAQADLRSGQRPVHPRTPRCAVPGSPRRRQELFGPSLGLSGHQGRLRRAV